nr:serine/threonine-protein kinase/endoribonuclease IRE1a isoform X2 [Tanacetum cinerariifolium]
LTAAEVYHHPLFWNPEFRLSFLQNASDLVELEGRKPDSIVLKAIEASVQLLYVVNGTKS